MIPYFIFSWLQITIKILMSKSVNSRDSFTEFVTILFAPVAQFWFLYALMIIFMIVSFLEFKLSNEIYRFFIIITLFILSITLFKNFKILTISLNNIIYFYFGTILFKKVNFRNIKNKTIACNVVAYLLLNVLHYSNAINFSYNFLNFTYLIIIRIL